MLNEMEKMILNGLFRNLRTSEIIEELRARDFILGDASERDAETLIRSLQARRAEARSCAQEAADKCVEAGMEWRDVVDYLSKPGLLHSGEVIRFASAAFDKVAEK